MKKLELNINLKSIGISESVRIFAELIKFRITFLITLTTAMGYILASDSFFSSQEMVFVSSGIFLLAAAASCLNQLQERYTDSLMERTADRPLPSGRIDSGSVLLLFSILLLSGSLILLLKSGLYAFLIGVLTLIWYNFIYTPLKRKTALSVIPGALVGALPPLAGWVSAGGHVFDSRILSISLYFFVWQIPHFWLLLMIYGDDYRRAGFPTLRSLFNNEQLKRITFIWIIGTVLTALSLTMFVKMNYELSFYVLLSAVIWMVFVSGVFFRSDLTPSAVRKTFMSLNFFTLLLVTIISLDKIIRIFT